MSVIIASEMHESCLLSFPSTANDFVRNWAVEVLRSYPWEHLLCFFIHPASFAGDRGLHRAYDYFATPADDRRRVLNMLCTHRCRPRDRICRSHEVWKEVNRFGVDGSPESIKLKTQTNEIYCNARMKIGKFCYEYMPGFWLHKNTLWEYKRSRIKFYKHQALMSAHSGLLGLTRLVRSNLDVSLEV